MTINKTLLALTACTVLSTQAFAYAIYNKTSHSLDVKDKAGLSGIKVTMPAGGTATCNPDAHDCHGKLSFEVYAPQNPGKVICGWEGEIDKKPGNYFVISETASQFPEPGSCNIEYYHD